MSELADELGRVDGPVSRVEGLRSERQERPMAEGRGQNLIEAALDVAIEHLLNGG